jgi:hypothetical protein
VPAMRSSGSYKAFSLAGARRVMSTQRHPPVSVPDSRLGAEMNGFLLLSGSRRARLLRSATAVVLAAGLAVAAPLVASTPASA